MKYEIRKFTIDYSKIAAKIRKQHKIDLEQKLKNFEKNLTSEENRKLYNHYKSELETIYDHIADDIKIRSKCEWYDHGEKSTKFFLNLVKKRGVQSRIRKFIAGEKEITDHKELSKNIKAYYETLFKRNFSKTNVEKQRFLNYLSNKTLTNEQYDLRENKISETDLFDSMKSMKNNKTSGSDGLTKEFYETFWDELKTPLMESVNQAFHTEILSISQRQAIIKLIAKNDHNKRYIKNWRPISLLNVDTKILSNAFSKKLETVLPTLISSQQTVSAKKRFIEKSGRLISDIIEISTCFNVTGILATMDI